MKLRQGPVADRVSLVLVSPQSHDQLGLALRRCPVQLCRGAIDRVAAQDRECAHLPGVQRSRQFADAALLGRGRLMEHDGLAQVAQRDVHGMGQRVHRQWLPLPRHHHALARVRQQVLRALGNPLRLHAGRLTQRRQRRGQIAAALRHDRRRQRRRHRQHRARRDPQTMVRIDAG